MDNIGVVTRYARFLRASVVRGQFDQGALTREEALELLGGPLSPGDPATVYDDTGLLDLDSDEMMRALGIEGPIW
jgi:hypothetical protein